MSTLSVETIDQPSTGDSQPSLVGSAKMWIFFDGSGTISIESDFNVSSITDNGVGLYDAQFSNNMANALFAGPASGTSGSGLGDVTCATKTTSKTDVLSTNTAGTFADYDGLDVSVFGDLA